MTTKACYILVNVMQGKVEEEYEEDWSYFSPIGWIDRKRQSRDKTITDGVNDFDFPGGAADSS